MKQLLYATPESLGLNQEKLNSACLLLDEAVAKKETPGAVGLVLYRRKIVAHCNYGLKSILPTPSPLTKDTIYDLASVSKCVATTTMFLMLLEKGALRLDDSVTYFYPEFNAKGKLRLRHLLTHTSGLPAWLPIYKNAFSRDDWLKALANTDLEYETGSKVVYSCLGFILLGLILEKVARESLAAFLKRELFDPLGMKDTGYNVGPLERVAPTEYSPAKNCILKGIVHDENAASLGGVSGNAGVFSTAFDLALFAAMLLSEGFWNNKTYLSPSSLRLMRYNHTSHLNDNRGLGWALKGEYSSGGDLLSPYSFGHTGFTGTSIWLDPALDLAIILLTNRVHPTREGGQGIIRLRALFANAVVGALPKTTWTPD